ncbi:malonyl CoA-acyl carrier protein transacylase [Neorickettsia risticii str. Illinois]|uniref:Malonyl CoA-acyl carrier protein transacylase n=1 Tax=Neorickettsia risticii (strain Illinois) TaxID=434131 RepID=C6V667_NEORI|nr:ACP S-malonyltransferase [Neorickettsia risticii]ACT69882.1 malonyl CoA-acyl carrier protein transacylase [Neorickettsia risticii str. Illinois]
MKMFLFPGQGSQRVGMGKSLYENFSVAREVFSEVDESLGMNLSKIMFEGPENILSNTENTQPALMATSMAALKVLLSESGKSVSELSKYLAGHSLGEYTALCASGAITISQVARVLKIRGKSMQEAVPMGEGGMLALLKVTFEEVQDLIVESKVSCEISNDNSNEQVVVSGLIPEIDKFEEYAKQNGIRRMVRLKVSAPFHCKLMQHAVIPVKDALDNAEIVTPSVPIVSNVTASPVTEVQRIRELLVQQITSCVRWRESMLFSIETGVETFIEIGAGNVLSKMLSRMNPHVTTLNLGEVDDLDRIIATIG